MADFTPIPRCIQVRIQGQHTSGKKVFNLLHFRSASALPPLGDIVAAVAFVSNWVTTNYKLCYSAAITVNEILGRSNAEEPGPTYTDDTINQPGTLLGDMLPLSTSMCATLRTGLTGISNRGRFFAFPATETETAAGLFNAAHVVIVETQLGQLVLDATTAVLPWVVESRRHLRLTPIIGGQGNVVPAHLASRKVNRGI